MLLHRYCLQLTSQSVHSRKCLLSLVGHCWRDSRQYGNVHSENSYCQVLSSGANPEVRRAVLFGRICAKDRSCRRFGKSIFSSETGHSVASVSRLKEGMLRKAACCEAKCRRRRVNALSSGRVESDLLPQKAAGALLFLLPHPRNGA